MSNQKNDELYVSYELKDDAKKLGRRWDSVKNRWYALSEKFLQDTDLYNDFRSLALATTNLVSTDLKLLGCKFNMEYKKWTV
jgi:glucokinase